MTPFPPHPADAARPARAPRASTLARALLACFAAAAASAAGSVASADTPSPASPPPAPSPEATARPDILLIIVDDLNDWVGYSGTHPLVRTPNFDRLAARGTAFLNAHCQSPLCNPSRVSLLSGLRPGTTGIYALAPAYGAVPEAAKHPTLPAYLRRQGWQSRTIGKVWHVATKEQWAEDFDVAGKIGKPDPRPPAKLVGPTPVGNPRALDWGVFPHRDEDKKDYLAASWAAEQLASPPADGAPLFLALGFSLPHVPCYVTQRWADLYPDDDSILPPVLAGDRDDTPRFSWYLHWSLPEPRLSWLRARDQWRAHVRFYLASISFMDAQLGRVLDALDASGRADRTLVVLVGDNGYHLGEKEISGKNTLWEPSTRVPFLLAGPGVPAGARVTEPVELLDIYPTLMDLAGLPAPAGLEGLSLRPQLADPAAPRARPAITTHGPGNDAVRSARWRYIRYADGSEELYDLQNDPHEWTNLAGRPEHAAVIAEHRRWLPTDKPPAPGGKERLIYRDPATGVTTWQGEVIAPDAPIPDL